jgi:hypothetical protein
VHGQHAIQVFEGSSALSGRTSTHLSEGQQAEQTEKCGTPVAEVAVALLAEQQRSLQLAHGARPFAAPQGDQPPELVQEGQLLRSSQALGHRPGYRDEQLDVSPFTLHRVLDRSPGVRATQRRISAGLIVIDQSHGGLDLGARRRQSSELSMAKSSRVHRLRRADLIATLLGPRVRFVESCHRPNLVATQQRRFAQATQ